MKYTVPFSDIARREGGHHSIRRSPCSSDKWSDHLRSNKSSYQPNHESRPFRSPATTSRSCHWAPEESERNLWTRENAVSQQRSWFSTLHYSEPGEWQSKLVLCWMIFEINSFCHAQIFGPTCPFGWVFFQNVWCKSWTNVFLSLVSLSFNRVSGDIPYYQYKYNKL